MWVWVWVYMCMSKSQHGDQWVKTASGVARGGRTRGNGMVRCRFTHVCKHDLRPRPRTLAASPPPQPPDARGWSSRLSGRRSQCPPRPAAAGGEGRAEATAKEEEAEEEAEEEEAEKGSTGEGGS